MSKRNDPSLHISGSKFLITLCAMMASLMAVLDISIVNVALSDIRASFGVQIDQIAWISTGYMIANVIVIPLTGWFQKKFGVKNYFVFSVLLFTLASALCAISWNLLSLTLFRVLQGIGGGAIIPTASTLLIARYPREQQGMAQAFIGIGAMTGPLLGPSLGGYLIDLYSWHLIFLINVPFGILAAYIAYKSIQAPYFLPSNSKMDKLAVILLVLGLGCLQFILEEGNRKDWFDSSEIIFFSILCVVCLITLVVQQLESKEPMIDFKVFLDRNYTLSTIVNFFLGVTLFSASFLFSLFCGIVLKYTPLDIGILFLKGCFIQIFMMPIIGKVVPKIDGRILIGTGIAFVATSIWMNSKLTDNSYDHQLITILFIRSVGLSFIFVPLSVLAMSQLSNSVISQEQLARRDLGNAIGLFNLTRELGGSIGLAVMSTHLFNKISEFNSNLSNHLNKGSAIVTEQFNTIKMMLLGKVANLEQGSYLFLKNKVNLQSTILSFNLNFESLSLIFFAIILIVFFLQKPAKDKNFNIEGLH